MIAALILYSIAVTTLFAIAAVAAEHLLRLSRSPARMVWMSAMLGALILSALRFQSALTPPASVRQTVGRSISASLNASTGSFGPTQTVRGNTTTPRLETPSTPTAAARVRDALGRIGTARIAVATGSIARQLDRPLVSAWVLLSMIALAIVCWSAVRLARSRNNWEKATINGIPVFVSHDLGPAVIGVLRYRIVLPSWALEMAPAERDLILAHEGEHARVGDPSLLFGATVLVALMPWNVPLWWMARRLRYAIELDCDSRVLRSRPDPRAYGSLLLDVSERTVGGAMPIAALAEPVSLIERRITAMTARVPRFVQLRVAGAGVTVVSVVALACATPRPESAPAPTTIPAAATAPQVVSSPPGSTERTPAVAAAAESPARRMMQDSLPARGSVLYRGDSVFTRGSVARGADSLATSAKVSGMMRDSLRARLSSSVVGDSLQLVGGSAAAGRGQSIRFSPGVDRGPRRLSADFRGQSVQDVLSTFSNITGRSIVAAPDVQANITATVTDVSWDVALRSILALSNLEMRELGNGDIVVTRKDSRDLQMGGYGYGGPGGVSLRSSAGAVDSTYPRIVVDAATIAGTLTRDSASWSAAQRGYRLSVDAGPGSSAISGGLGTAGRSASAGGGYGGGGTVAVGATAGTGERDVMGGVQIDRRSERARSIAAQQFPAAFDVHDGELYEIVLVFDPSGAIVAKGAKARSPLVRGESILDRDLMSRVLPGFSFNSLYEWGMSNVSSPRQRDGSGVVVFFGFTGRAPW